MVPDPLMSDPPHVGLALSNLTIVSPDEFEVILSSMSGKSSPLDFVPTSVLKTDCDTFSHVIAQLANLSFMYGIFPAKFETAQVTPLLKKIGLGDSNPANY